MQSRIPSWVPDWSAPWRASPFIAFSTPGKFSATLGTISHPNFRQDGRSLGLQGHVVDIVDVIGMASSENIEDSPTTE